MINDIMLMDNMLLIGKDNTDLKGYKEQLTIKQESDLIDFWDVPSEFGIFPDDLYDLLNNNSNFQAWYPFCEADRNTGYTPNAANTSDSSVDRLAFTNFAVDEGIINNALFCKNGGAGHMLGVASANLAITGNLSLIIWHTWDDAADSDGTMLEYRRENYESESSNILYSVRSLGPDGDIRLRHEYGSGGNEFHTTTLEFTRDDEPHMLMVRRDTSVPRYELSLDNGSVLNQAYINNPTGGSISWLSLPSDTEAHADGWYYNIMIFDTLLTDAQVTTIYNAGRPRSSWFDYSNWNGATGSGYVSWVRS